MHFDGTLSARNLCVIAWYAVKAGVKGPIGDFAFRPNAPTRHDQRRVDSAAGGNMRAQRKHRCCIWAPSMVRLGPPVHFW